MGLLQKLLSIPASEASFAQREFHFLRHSTRERLERVGETFLCGYHLALADEGIEFLAEGLNEVDHEFRGYAFEGAAMGLDLLDRLKPWSATRVAEFLRGPASPHTYMAHVGIGWSMARWGLGMERRLARLEPLLRWLALDGFGFHEGYFRWTDYAKGAAPKLKVHSTYASRAFDQGLGRSLWFVSGADPEHISCAMAHFAEVRHPDLWSGIGLACGYAGGANDDEVRAIHAASGECWPHLAQGTVFAAGARQRAGNPAAHTEVACRILCDITAQRAAELCEETLRNVTAAPDQAYEEWRQLIREHLQLNETLNEVAMPSSSKERLKRRGANTLVLPPAGEA
jgi:enediyne biosynthesis protein E3